MRDSSRNRASRRARIRRHVSGVLALAAAGALVAPAGAATDTWSGATSTDWNNNGNWSAGSPPGSTDIAAFTGTPTTNQPQLTSGTTVGELSFGTTSGWTLSSSSNSNVLQLNSLTGTGIVDAATTGTDTISANIDVFYSQTWSTSGGTMLISGVMSDNAGGGNGGSGTLTFGGGTFNLQAANTYSGAVTVNAGNLMLSGANGSLASDTAGFTLNGGTLTINDTSAAGGNKNDRLGTTGSTMPVTFAGGKFVFDGADAAGTPSYETMGGVTIASGLNVLGGNVGSANGNANNSILTITPGGSNAAQLTMTSISRSADNPLLLINGTNLGSATGGQAILQVQPTVFGGGLASATDSAANAKTADIVPFLLGEIASGVGTQTGTPNTFLGVYPVTITSGPNQGAFFGLRPLDPANDFATTVGTSTAGSNVYISSAQSATAAGTGGNVSINSLVVNGGDLSIDDNVTVHVASGALLFPASNNVLASNNTGANNGTLDFAGPEALVTVNPGKTAAINAVMTNSGGGDLTFTGTGQLNVQSVSSAFSGNITNIGGVLQFGDGTNASKDGMLPGNINLQTTGYATSVYLNFANVNTQTFPGNIYASIEGNTWIYTANKGTLNLTGSSLVMDSPNGGAPFFGFYGSGAVNITGNITQNYLGGLYFYDFGSGPITLGGNITAQVPNFYMSPVPFNLTTGSTTTNPVTGAPMSPVTGMQITLASTGSIGGPFTGTGASAVPTPNSVTTGMTITNMNRARTTAVPSPVVFISNGPINASGGSGGLIDVAYYSGQTTWYVNAPVAAAGFIRVGYNSHVDGSTAEYGAVYVAPNVPMISSPFASNYQLGYVMLGYGNFADGSSAYMNLGSGALLANEGTSSTTYIGYRETGYLDLTNLQANGSSGPGSTLNSLCQITINGGGSITAGTASELTLWPGSTVNMTGPATAALATTLNASTSAALGDRAFLNIIGGTYNNVNSTGTTSSGAGLNLLGNGNDDNVNLTKLPTAVVNLNNSGILRTNFVHGETIVDNSIPGTASNYINFNKGELDYNGYNTGTPASLVTNGIAGLMVYSGGATVGTTFTGSGYTSTAVSINQALLAPPGNGLQSINFSNPIGSGYNAPPVVVITDSQGFDATAYAVIDSKLGDGNYGKIISIVVTNPGFNMSGSPTITFQGGGGTAPATTDYTLTFGPNTSGGLTKIFPGTLTLNGTYAGAPGSTNTAVYSLTATGTDANASGYTGLGNNPAVNAGNAGPGVINNTSTYTGPTVIETGTLALVTSASTAVTGQTATYPATNNNIPFSAAVIVGDTAANKSAVLDVTGIHGAGGFQLAHNQILAGFGTVHGSNTVGLTIGAAPTGNNFGGFSSLGTSGGVGSIVSPGSTAALGTVQGTATTTATGALTLSSGSSGSPMITTFGGNGTYYWKLNLGTGGAATASTPATPGQPAVATAAGANVTGTSWDALVMDTIAVSASSSSPFAIQAVGFTNGSSNAVHIGGSNTQSYAWVIGRVNDQTLASIGPATLQSEFVLNSSAMPAPATGYGYMLSTQQDPSIPADSDLVVSYAPTPEPTTMLTLSSAAGAMFLRRRRRAARAGRTA